MQRDIRTSDIYTSIADYYSALLAPGQDSVIDGRDLDFDKSGKKAAFTGDIFTDMASAPISVICTLDLDTGVRSTLPHGGANARLPLWSPDGSALAFLRELSPGNFQIHIQDRGDTDARTGTPLPGMVEAFQWSADGTQILAAIAGFGADLAGAQGGATTVSVNAYDLPDWMPDIDTGDADNLWRDIYIIDVATLTAKRINPEGTNVWEACWLGPDMVAVIMSTSHSEGSWYTSRLVAIDMNGHIRRDLHRPTHQIGVPAASPSGRHIAVVEAVCSDRLIVCGTLLIINVSTGATRAVDTLGTDVTHCVWVDDKTLVYTGRRAFEVVYGRIDTETLVASDIWASADYAGGAWYPRLTAAADGTIGAILENFNTPPAIVSITSGDPKVLWSLAPPEFATGDFNTANIEEVRWTARDGLEIHGWLVRPKGDGPFPVVMNIHGGPVYSFANRWQSRVLGAGPLAERGIATFLPNVRGSSARGQDYALKVKGDMGGEDTYDFLTGLDKLVADGIADPDRIGVTGISYGGFSSCWLITQDDRFAAAVPVSPVCNWYSQHNTSQIPHFDRLFLDDRPFSADSLYFDRSPVMFADKVKTPTLILTGGVDQNTPPTQALEFHRALLEAGTKSVLVTYPKAGHGIRNYPDVLDHVARSVSWFLEYLAP